MDRKDNIFLGWVITTMLLCLFISSSHAQSSWTTMQGPPQPRNVRDLTLSGDGMTLYIADQTKVYKSTDGGSTWATTASEIVSPITLICQPDTPSNVLVGASTFINRSSDGGGSWEQKLSSIIPLKLSVSTLHQGDMFLGLDGSGDVPSFYYSSDGGRNWHVVSGADAVKFNDAAPYPVSDGTHDHYALGAGSDPTKADGTSSSTHGVYLSTTDGHSWSNSSLNTYNISAVAIKHGDPIYWYAGTLSGKVFKTDNAGSQWYELTSYNSLNATVVHSIKTRTDNNWIYVASDKGIHKSTNYGADWTQLLTMDGANLNVLSMTIVPGSQSTIIATTTSTIYKSTNGGTTWVDIGSGAGSMPVYSITSHTASSTLNMWTASESFSKAGKYDGSAWTTTKIGQATETFVGKMINRHSNGTLFAAGATNNVATLYHSTDGGSTYPLSYQPSGYSNTIFYGTIVDPSYPSYVYLFGYAKDNSNSVRNYLISSDYGSTWSDNLTPINSSSTVQDLAIDNSSGSPSWTLYAALQNGGIYKTVTCGNNWSQIFPYTTSDVRSLTISSSQTSYLYAATDIGVWRSTNSGSSWIQVRAGSHKKAIMNPNVTSSYSFVWVIPNDGSKIYYTPDGGYTWIDGTGNLPTPIYNVYGETSTPNSAFAATDQGVYKLNVLSQAPTLNTPSNPPGGSNPGINPTLTWSSVTGATHYHLQVATDNQFTNIIIDQAGLTSTSYTLTTIESPTTLYWKVASGNLAGEYFSGSQSFTTALWGSIMLYVEGCTVNGVHHPKLHITPTNQYGTFYIYRYGCAYGGGDCGAWPYLLIAATSDTPYIDYDVISWSKGFPRNTTYYYQVRSATISETKHIDSPEDQEQKLGVTDNLPRETSLEENYPNPFNPITTIRYSLAIDTRVSLRIFDVLGQEVATLMDEAQSAGFKSVEFNASNLPSGVYFYRLQAGKFIDVKKMLVTK